MTEHVEINPVSGTTNGTVNVEGVKPLSDVLKEVRAVVEAQRSQINMSAQSIKDLRWQFDQTSAKMNQAIYNDESNKIHETCLQTVTFLIEILARTR